MNAGRKPQDQLIREAEELALRAKSNNRLGESYIIESNAKLVESNARVEGEIGNLINKLKEFNRESTVQTKELISLTKSIKKLNSEASTQTEKLVVLTKWIVVLTIVLVIGLIIQLITSK